MEYARYFPHGENEIDEIEDVPSSDNLFESRNISPLESKCFNEKEKLRF
jgi:hypothetical protein